MLIDKPFHPLGSLVCLPLVLRTLAETHNARDNAHQIGNPALEGRMRRHQAHEGLREWLEGRFVMRRHAAAARSSLSAPRMTISSASSGDGRCSAFASSQGARIQMSRSSSVVKITGIALSWIGATTAFGA